MKKKLILGMIFLLMLGSRMTIYATQNPEESSNLDKIPNEGTSQTENSSAMLTSNSYLVSELNQYISRIMPKTEITEFKKQFSVEEGKIHLYQENQKKEEVTQGYVGTGMILSYEGGKKEYQISVIGDFNGDGQANQIELNRLIKQVVGIKGYELEGMNQISGDINTDGILDQRDIGVLIRYLVYGTLENQEIKKPIAPSIEIVSGELSDKNCYITDVLIKMTENKVEGVENLKTIYQVTGPKVVEETEITKENTILLTEEGTYTITAYTYSKEGMKSTASKLTLTINKTLPQAGGIIAKLNNEQGENYLEGSYTNQNVYIAVKAEEEGTEVSYEVTGSNIVEKGHKEPIILSKEGVSKVIVTTKNEGGNITTKEFMVNIDKRAPEKPSFEISGEKLLETSSWYTNQVTIKINPGIDNGISGVKEVSYTISGDATVAESTLAEGDSIVLSNGGIYTVKAYTKDKAGNKSIAETAVVKIDKENPTAATLEMKQNNGIGNNYENDTWTNQSVFLHLVEGVDSQSGILKSTYSITGPKEIKDAVADVTLEAEGIYTIAITTMDQAGRVQHRNYTVKIDKTLPEMPQIQIVSGEKKEATNEWYISNVSLQVLPVGREDGGSGIQKTTYRISGAIQRDEVDITEAERIELLQDGMYNITAYTYDISGNRSEGRTITIKRDATAPKTANLAVGSKNGTSYTLVARGEDETSKIKGYSFYIDGQLYQEVENYNNQVECMVEKQKSEEHECYLVVEDMAGNQSSSAVIKIKPGRLDYEDIEYVELQIENFAMERNGGAVNSGATYIISDTSSSNVSKFLQVTSNVTGTKGILTGKVGIIRKDGTRADSFEYFPEDLKLQVSHYMYGSGTTWSHHTKVDFFGTMISVAGAAEGTTTTKTVSLGNAADSNNHFILEDQKQDGTQTYTRAIIQAVTSSGKNLNFKITNTIL